MLNRRQEKLVTLAESKNWEEFMLHIVNEKYISLVELKQWIYWYIEEYIFPFFHEYFCFENKYSNEFKQKVLSLLFNARFHVDITFKEFKLYYSFLKISGKTIEKKPDSQVLQIIWKIEDFRFIKQLVKKFPDLLNMTLDYNSSLVGEAIRDDFIEMIEWFMQFKPNLNLTYETDGGISNSYLNYAIIKNYSLVEKMINNGADVNYMGSSETSPLNVAISTNRMKIINFLLQNGANINTRSSSHGSPLENAIRMKNWKLVSKFLEMDLEIYNNKSGNTPLYNALKKNAPPDLITKLLQKGFLLSKSVIKFALRKQSDINPFLRTIIFLLQDSQIENSLKTQWLSDIAEHLRYMQTEKHWEIEVNQILDKILSLDINDDLKNYINKSLK